MNRLFASLWILTLLIMACTPPAETTPTVTETDPVDILAQVINNFQQVETFKMTIQQDGAEFAFLISLDGGETNATASLIRAEGQFVAPEDLFANVNLQIGIPISMDIYARGADQWIRPPGSPTWINFPFSEGFDPGALMRNDSGFESALSNLREVVYLGIETLVDGTSAHRIQGMADGQVVSDLLFGMLNPQGEVLVDAFVTQDTLMPVQLDVILLGTETEDEPEPTRWSVEIYDINAPADIDTPQASEE